MLTKHSLLHFLILFILSFSCLVFIFDSRILNENFQKARTHLGWWLGMEEQLKARLVVKTQTYRIGYLDTLFLATRLKSVTVLIHLAI